MLRWLSAPRPNERKLTAHGATLEHERVTSRSLRSRSWLGLVASVCVSLAALGCDTGRHDLGGQLTWSRAAMANQKAGRCANGDAIELIDDLEDGDGSIPKIDNRSGSWFSFNDGSPGTQVPSNTAERFIMEHISPSRDGSNYGAHTYGNGFTLWGAGIGFELDSQEPYDASPYAGLSFWVRAPVSEDPGIYTRLRVGVPELDTIPNGHYCNQDAGLCHDDYGAFIDMTDAWQHVMLPWSALTQQGFQVPPAALTPNQLTGIQFQVNGSDLKFDYWIDDVGFLCPN